MALEVEDGTGKENATSYISLADADDYFELRGNEDWSGEDEADREAALVRATFGMDSWLRGRWVGTKLTQAQALAWPREGAEDEDGFEIPEDEVPIVVQHACAEIALIELSGTSFQSTSQSAADSVSSETVGPISVTYKDSAQTITTYPHIEALLRGVAATSGVVMSFNVGLTQDELDAMEDEPDVFDFEEYFINATGM